MWYAKMYVSGRHEIFEFDAYGVQGAPSARKVLPFLESLLSFLELDCRELTPMFQKIGDSWERRIAECDREAGTAAMMELGKLAARHIYFRLLYVRWFERMNCMGLDQDWGSEEDWNMLSELRQLPEQLLLHLIPHIVKVLVVGVEGPAVHVRQFRQLPDGDILQILLPHQCRQCRLQLFPGPAHPPVLIPALHRDPSPWIFYGVLRRSSTHPPACVRFCTNLS